MAGWRLYLRHSVELGLLVLNLLLDELFFLLAQIHLVHLDHQLVPRLFLLDFLGLLPCVLRLDVSLDALGTLSRAVRWLNLLARCRLLLLCRGLLLLLSLSILLGPINKQRWRGPPSTRSAQRCTLNTALEV